MRETSFITQTTAYIVDGSVNAMMRVWFSGGWFDVLNRLPKYNMVQCYNIYIYFIYIYSKNMIYVNVCVIIAMIPLTVQNDIEYITQHVTINIWLVRIGFWPFISCCIHVQMHFIQKICSVCVCTLRLYTEFCIRMVVVWHGHLLPIARADLICCGFCGLSLVGRYVSKMRDNKRF